MPKTRITLDLDHDTLQWFDDYAQALKKAGHKVSRNELVRRAMEEFRNKIILGQYNIDDKGK